MSFVLNLQASLNDDPSPDSPSTWSVSICGSTQSVWFC